jgi:hypothetical protein
MEATAAAVPAGELAEPGARMAERKAVGDEMRGSGPVPEEVAPPVQPSLEGVSGAGAAREIKVSPRYCCSQDFPACSAKLAACTLASPHPCAAASGATQEEKLLAAGEEHAAPPTPFAAASAATAPVSGAGVVVKRKKRGRIRGPLHKLAKEVRKAFA